MEKKRKIILWALYGVLVAATIITFVFSNQIYGVNKGIDPADPTGTTIIWDPPSFFAQFTNDNAFLNYMGVNFMPNLLRSIQIITIAIALGILLHFLAKITFRTKKGITISKLMVNFIKWVIAIATVFLVMGAWGANTTMMLASAGVLTLIIGLGSQTLVADILAGIFIVFEGDFQVGDIVIIDGWRGEVESIGVRTTRLIDAGGNVKIVNNSEIKTIINQTKELSIAKCYVAISYEARIENVEAIIADNIDKLKDKIPGIVEGPFYKGVSELAESSVNLLFVAKCKENDIYQVQRDLNREIKILFDDNNINIPYNQLVVHMAEDDDKKETVTKKNEKKAQEFTEEQKELSKDVEIKESL
ncbi:MAG: mechanosensitive ion channel family protein [Bacilli bacterium]|nr:mechanosensitive ion channel family protein [Bacilli bacterium]